MAELKFKATPKMQAAMTRAIAAGVPPQMVIDIATSAAEAAVISCNEALVAHLADLKAKAEATPKAANDNAMVGG